MFRPTEAAVKDHPVGPDRLAATGNGIAGPGPEPGWCQPSRRPLRHTYRMDRREDDEDRVAAPEPYWRDIRLIRVVALLAFVVGAVIPIEY